MIFLNADACGMRRFLAKCRVATTVAPLTLEWQAIDIPLAARPTPQRHFAKLAFFWGGGIRQRCFGRGTPQRHFANIASEDCNVAFCEGVRHNGYLPWFASGGGVRHNASSSGRDAMVANANRGVAREAGVVATLAFAKYRVCRRHLRSLKRHMGICLILRMANGHLRSKCRSLINSICASKCAGVRFSRRFPALC